MSLRTDIEDIKSKILSGSFANEAMVSQGVVLRLLASLGWPVFDGTVVYPQFALENLRVDYALCHPPQKPKLLVEVKNVGKAGEAQHQLFQYAFHAGAQMAILTDGQDWNFYLPGASGDYDERRYYRLDLVARDVAECEKRLLEFLSFEAVKSGQALNAAQKTHQDRARRNEVKRAIPVAWQKLHAEPDSLLVEMLIECTAVISGFTPDRDEVVDFLVSAAGKTLIGFSAQSGPSSLGVTAANPIATKAGTFPPQTHSMASTSPRRKGLTNGAGFAFTLFGERTEVKSAVELLRRLLEALSERDSNFMDRMSVRATGRVRRLLSKNREELYGDRKDLMQLHSERIGDGWWLGTNYAKREKQNFIAMAVEVSGLKAGKEVLIEFPDLE
jgi:hypothetical protein